MARKATRVKNATADVPDLRDRMYEPALMQLQPEMKPQHIEPRDILDQGYEGACTGFSLTAVIKWPGEDYEGSSLRGAIRGWKNNGVCTEQKWLYRKAAGRLTVARAKDARSHTVGAYYRLRPEIADFHAALNEAGIIAVTAQAHRGWDEPKEVLPFRKTIDGGHAFTIVRYEERGFYIQNSWGPAWGKGGLAIWTYEDWIQNLMDAWVVRLALPTPQIFGAEPQSAIGLEEVADPQQKAKVERIRIAGHFVHIDDGKFHPSGRYWSDNKDVKQTDELVAQSGKYQHLLVYAHGGPNSPEASAYRIRAMKDVFKQNGIYPFHVMYDTGLAEELSSLMGLGREERREDDAEDRAEDLTRRSKTLKTVLNVGSLILVAGILHMAAGLHWPAALTATKEQAAAVSSLAMAVCTFWGTIYSMVLAMMFVLPITLLRRRARSCVEQLGVKSTDEWLDQHGLALSLRGSLTQACVMIAPMLAAPVGQYVGQLPG